MSDGSAFDHDAIADVRGHHHFAPGSVKPAAVNRPRRYLRRTPALAGTVFVLAAYIYFAGRVDQRISPPTAALMDSLGLGTICANAQDTPAIVRCAGAIQKVIAVRIPGKACSPKGQSIEPVDMFKRGHACCFSRARFIELFFTHYGIKARRVSLYQTGRWGSLALLVPKVPSHAATEVLTPGGWMGVDSNEPFVLVTVDGKPLTYSPIRSPEVRARLVRKPSPDWFYRADYVVVRGLYSRHGYFIGPNLPGPEIDFADFLAYNFRGSTG